MDLPDWLEQMARTRTASPRDGGELLTAADIIRRARLLLERLEWGVDDTCPVCLIRGGPGLTHVNDCELGNLIDYIRAPERAPMTEEGT